MNIATVTKAAERAGTCSWLSVERRVRVSVEGIPVAEIAMVEVAVIEAVVTEIVAVDNRPAVGDVGVVIINH